VVDTHGIDRPNARLLGVPDARLRPAPAAPATTPAREAARPSGPVRVHVSWSEATTSELRARLEARYQLTRPQFVNGTTWHYVLVDTSDVNALALVNDPHAVDTHGIDRRTGELTGPPVETGWQRFLADVKVAIAPGILRPQNSIPWLYYLFLWLPPIAIGTLVLKRFWPAPQPAPMRREVPRILATASMCAVTTPFLLRDPLVARLPDAAAPIAILGAWVVSEWLRFLAPRLRPVGAGEAGIPSRTRGVPRWAPLNRALYGLGRAGLVLIVLVTLWSAAVAGNLELHLKRSGILDGPSALVQRTAQVTSELASTPSGDGPLARYVQECTRPSDRILATWFAPDLYFELGRPFAGDQVFFLPGYWGSTQDQERTISKIQAQAVPIVISHRQREELFGTHFPLIAHFVHDRYEPLPNSAFPDDASFPYRIWVDRQITPARTYEPLAWPCFI
jgi:hypothetical protein